MFFKLGTYPLQSEPCLSIIFSFPAEVYCYLGKCWNKLEEELSLAKKDDEPELAQALKPLTLMSKTVSPSKSIKQVWGDEPEPLDIERFMDCATIFDIMNYNHFVKSPLIGEATVSIS